MPPSPAARWYVWNGPMWAKRMPGPWLIAASMSATEACAESGRDCEGSQSRLWPASVAIGGGWLRRCVCVAVGGGEKGV